MQQALKPCHHRTLELQVLFAHLNLFEPISQAPASMCSTPFVQLRDSHMNQQHCNHPYTNRCIGVPSFNYANSESADIQICKHKHHFTIFLGYMVQTIPLATDVILQTVLLNMELHLSEDPNLHWQPQVEKSNKHALHCMLLILSLKEFLPTKDIQKNLHQGNVSYNIDAWEATSWSEYGD